MTRRWSGVARLTVGGGVGFWVANLAISLTPIAAEYRAALSIPYVPMLFEALVGGLVIALAVSVALVRAGDALPTASPVAKAILLSLVALVVVTLLVAVPSTLLVDSGDPVRYFLIATAFNAVRITALGMAIGLLHGWSARLDRVPRRSVKVK